MFRVRAKNHSINSSWNFSLKNKQDLNSALTRYEINKKINFRSLIPLKTLFLDIANREMNSLPIELIQFMKQPLEEEIDKSIKHEELSKKEAESNSNIVIETEPDV